MRDNKPINKDTSSEQIQERLTRDLDSFKDEILDVYDLDNYIYDTTEGKWNSHMWKKVAILKNMSGKGLLLDYEATGKRFNSLDEKLDFYISHPSQETEDEDGHKVISMPVYPEARIKLSINDIIKNAPKEEVKAGEFFKKCYGYNLRCESNLEDALSELQELGYFDSDSIIESREKSVGEKIADIVFKTFSGDCGPFGGEAPHRKDIKTVGLWSQNDDIWYTFNDDGSVDVDNSDYNDGFDEEEEIPDKMHYDSVLELINGETADGWFAYFKEELGGPEAAKEIEDIVQNMKDPDTILEEYDRITKEDEAWLDKKIEDHGFKIVSKQDYGSFRQEKPINVHYQIISNEGNKTKEDLDKEADWINDLLDQFEDRSGSPCTYNMGLQVDGFISCGFDCRATSDRYKDQFIEGYNSFSKYVVKHYKDGNYVSDISFRDHDSANNYFDTCIKDLETNPDAWNYDSIELFEINHNPDEDHKSLRYWEKDWSEKEDDDYIESLSLDEALVDNVAHTIDIPTGLKGQDDKRILDSLIGQLSDGKWENSPRMGKWWKYTKPELLDDDEVFIKVPRDFQWYLGVDTRQDILKFYATHLKQLMKEILEGNKDLGKWDRNNSSQIKGYFHEPEPTVQDVYRIYDKLLGRKDRVNKYDYIENLGERLSEEEYKKLNEDITPDYNVIKVLDIQYNFPLEGRIVYRSKLDDSDYRLCIYNSKRGPRVTMGRWSSYPCTLFFLSEGEGRSFLNSYVDLIQENGATFGYNYKESTSFYPTKTKFDSLHGITKLETNIGTCYAQGFRLDSWRGDLEAHLEKTDFIESFDKKELENKIRDILKYDKDHDGKPYLFEIDDAKERASKVEGDPFWIERFDDDVVDFSVLKVNDSTTNENGSNPPVASFMISGGKNGWGKWSDYLSQLKDVFIQLKKETGCEPLLYKIDTDIADDVWTGFVFMYDHSEDVDEKLTEDLIVIEPDEAKEKFDELVSQIKSAKDEKTRKSLLTLMNIYLFQTYKPSDNPRSDITDDEWDEYSEFEKLERSKLKEAVKNIFNTGKEVDLDIFIKDWVKNTLIHNPQLKQFIREKIDHIKKEKGVSENKALEILSLENAKKHFDPEFDISIEELAKREFSAIKNILYANINVTEDIEKHDNLNPKLFDGEELKPEVKETIKKITNEFISEFANDGIKFDLKDIVLLGSNVSYNYTKDSDLDIHLIADSKNLHCPDELYPLLYSAYRSMFNHNYNITIKGIPAEVFVEMDECNAKSNGIYSLSKGWIKKPVQTSIPELDREAFEKLFTEWEDRYFDLIGKDDISEKLHPEVDLGWLPPGKRHLVDADTFTTKKEGDIISVHISDDLPDIQYKIRNGSYLDDEAVKDSPYYDDKAIEVEPVSDSSELFGKAIIDLIDDKVKKAILDLLKKEYKSEFKFYSGGTTDNVVPMAISLVTKNRSRRIPSIYSDREEVIESFSQLKDDDKKEFAEYVGCKVSDIYNDYSNIEMFNGNTYGEVAQDLGGDTTAEDLEEMGYPIGWVRKDEWDKFIKRNDLNWASWQDCMENAKDWESKIRLIKDKDTFIESEKNHEN